MEEEGKETPDNQVIMNDNIDITGVSYVGRPKSNTAVFVVKKVEYLLNNLRKVRNCLVFIDESIVIPEDIRTVHCYRVSKNPQAEYSRFVTDFYRKKEAEYNRRRYTYTDNGVYLGENVIIGQNTYIEPNCIIGHDVVIGDNCFVESRAVVKHAIVGSHTIIRNGAVIGGEGFTMTVDEAGNWIHTPSVGGVIIGDYVEIGINSVVARGTADDTVVEHNAKLDALVYIGHDARIESNTVISAGSILGGYVEAKERTKIGFNACVRNRLVLGENSVIGMGATVVSEVSELETVVGNPARVYVK